MSFTAPAWVPELPDIPDNVPLPDFMFDENHGRNAALDSKHPFVCGLSGRSYSVNETRDRIDFIARAIKEEFGWAPGEGTEWEKALGIFSLNTIDTITVASSIHRLDGIATMVNAAYTVPELVHQLKSSRAKGIFTCASLLPITIEAVNQVGIPKSRIYILEVPNATAAERQFSQVFKTVEQLITQGSKLPSIQRVQWAKGQATRHCAFLCYSSGTSGLPKGVMISHRNIIANVIQIKTYESKHRDTLAPNSRWTEVALGLLPQSHIYGLVVISYSSIYRGDSVVILPKFEMYSFLNAIQKFRINLLYVVPPIIIQMINNKELLARKDLSSVYAVLTGAAPLGAETAADLQKQYPSWKIRQAYGLTECAIVCVTSCDDVWLGSSGSLVPGYKARIVSTEGVDLASYDQPGELLVCSPSNTLGYLDNKRATNETFVVDENGDRWLRTGDEAVIRKSPSGNEHVYIIDRIKELIKVNSMQVAPAELEAHLLTHPGVADVAVIPVPDNRAGELPKAYVVKSPHHISKDNASLALDIQNYVKSHKARHKWLQGGVEFIDVIPKSPSGKILRRQLCDRESKRRNAARLNL